GKVERFHFHPSVVESEVGPEIAQVKVIEINESQTLIQFRQEGSLFRIDFGTEDLRQGIYCQRLQLRGKVLVQVSGELQVGCQFPLKGLDNRSEILQQFQPIKGLGDVDGIQVQVHIKSRDRALCGNLSIQGDASVKKIGSNIVQRCCLIHDHHCSFGIFQHQVVVKYSVGGKIQACIKERGNFHRLFSFSRGRGLVLCSSFGSFGFRLGFRDHEIIYGEGV